MEGNPLPPLAFASTVPTPCAPDLDQVLTLLTSRHSDTLAQRHGAALGKIAAANEAAGGFHTRDLPALVPVLTAALDKSAEAADPTPYAEPLVRLMSLAGERLRSAGASDPLVLFDAVVGLVAVLGHATAAVHIPEAAAAAATALAKYDAAGRPAPDAPLVYNAHAVAISGCVALMVAGLRRALEAGPRAHAVEAAVLDALLSLSRSLPSHCAQIADADGVALLGCLFGRYASDFGRLEVLTELLWNVLEAVAEAHAQMDDPRMLVEIKDVVVTLFNRGRKRDDRHLRNEVLILATLLANSGYVNPDAFVAARFTHVLLALAVAVETKTLDPELGPEFSLRALGCSDEDFEMKCLLWNLVLSTTTTNDGVDALVDSGFVPVLLMYLDPAAEADTLLQWTMHQYYKLQCLAASLLFHLAVEVPSVFAAARGPVIIVEAFVGHMDEPLPGLLRTALLRIILNTAGLFATQYGELGVIAILLALIKDPTLDAGLRRDAALTLSILTTDNAANQAEFLDEGGVRALISLLKYDAADPDRVPALILAALDCVWSAVIGGVDSETEFLRRDGLFALLDLLDAPALPEDLLNHGLGVVLDLLEHPYTIAYVRKWRSGRDAARSFAHVLLDAWELAQASLGVAVDPNGVILNLHTPLAPNAAVDYQPTDAAAAAAAANEHDDDDDDDDDDDVASDGDASAARAARAAAEEAGSRPSSAVAAVAEYRHTTLMMMGPDEDGGELGGAFDRDPEPAVSANNAAAAAGGGGGGAPAAAVEVIHEAGVDADAGAGADADAEQLSPAIMDVRANMRAKVFALFCKLGFQGHEGLSLRQKTALRLVVEYFKYKVGEVWIEIEGELEAEGVRPISPDHSRLATMHAYIHESADVLQGEQVALVERERERELQAEAEMYAKILENDSFTRGSQARESVHGNFGGRSMAGAGAGRRARLAGETSSRDSHVSEPAAPNPYTLHPYGFATATLDVPCRSGAPAYT